MFINHNTVEHHFLSVILKQIVKKTYVIDSFYQVLKTPSKHPDKVHR